MTKQELVNSVLKQIKKDVAMGDVTAIEELLFPLSQEQLKSYITIHQIKEKELVINFLF